MLIFTFTLCYSSMQITYYNQDNSKANKETIIINIKLYKNEFYSKEKLKISNKNYHD